MVWLFDPKKQRFCCDKACRFRFLVAGSRFSVHQYGLCSHPPGPRYSFVRFFQNQTCPCAFRAALTGSLGGSESCSSGRPGKERRGTIGLGRAAKWNVISNRLHQQRARLKTCLLADARARILLETGIARRCGSYQIFSRQLFLLPTD
jgi:hypothetical protein